MNLVLLTSRLGVDFRLSVVRQDYSSHHSREEEGESHHSERGGVAPDLVKSPADGRPRYQTQAEERFQGSLSQKLFINIDIETAYFATKAIQTIVNINI